MSAPAGDGVVAGLYDGIAARWAGDAELVYAPLARALVEAGAARAGAAWPAGELVVDVGAGTGAGSRALATRGARVLAFDLAAGMLAHGRAERPPACVADVRSLPLASGSVGAVLAPFVLNHLAEPEAGLLEAHRVVQPGGLVLASTFDEEDRPAVKDVIDQVAAAHGWVAPPAYAWLKEEALPRTGTAHALEQVAVAAGLVDVAVEHVAVDTGVTAPADLVRYRFGQAHLAGFVDAQPPAARAALVDEAIAAVARVHDGRGLAPAVLFLVARAPR